MFCWNPDDYHIYAARFDPAFTENLPIRVVAQAPEGGSVYFGDWSPDLSSCHYAQASGKYIAYAMNPNVEFKAPKTRALWDIFVTYAGGGRYVQVTFDHANNKQPEFFSPARAKNGIRQGNRQPTS